MTTHRAAEADRPRLRTLPKAELHLHIEGTLEPELAFELAERNGVELPFADADALRRAYDFSDLQSFLDLYYACMSVLQQSQDFEALADAYFARAAADGVRHAELFFDPQAHTARGVPIEAVLEGLDAAVKRAERDRGITGGLILCFLRDRSTEDALATLDAVAHRADWILGVGLDSAEVGNPASRFAEPFERARALGLRVVAHAGEEGGPDSVLDALDTLHAERIDHGVRSIEDPALVRRLVDEDIALTVCPLSNLRLGVVPALERHPLPRMVELGLRVTLHSDDPAYFGGFIGDVYEQVADAFGYDEQAMARFARESITASFAAPERVLQLLAEVDAWAAAPADRGAPTPSVE